MPVNLGAQRLLRIGRNTADLERAVAFHRDALGFRVCSIPAHPPAWTRLPGIDAKPSRCALLQLGAQYIELTEFRGGAPCPDDGAACDLWFQHCAIVVGDMSTAHARVMRRGATAITQAGPQALPPAAGSVTAFKFRDPEGHALELIAFPPGTGDPCWQSADASGPALGIDHSAISVGGTERSIRFHAMLGLHVAARGINRGAAQQRLDGLVDDVVDVIALRAVARTPHLELLCYRSPRGRSNPVTRLDAIAADRLVWQVDDIDAILRTVRDGADPDAVVASGHRDGAGVALLRDPDGHLIVLTEAAAGAGS